MAEYNITDESNEVFTIDDLGNRDLVNVKDGNNVDYVIDANTNRYDSVGGSSLAYNLKGKQNDETPQSVYLHLYVQDHLYGTVALVQRYGLSVLERYEYDAYGNCQIMNASYSPRSSSSYAYPYYFTGRTLDTLDNGNLKIQDNRNRYYDTYTGRFFTQDPMGIALKPQRPDIFDMLRQYEEGMNLYAYVGNNPLMRTDPEGLACRYTNSYCVMAGLGGMAWGLISCNCVYGCVDYYIDDHSKPCTPSVKARTLHCRDFGGLCPFRFYARIVERRRPGWG